MLLSFFIVWLCINLVCSIPDAALKFPRENAGKVSQKCHSACVIQRTTGNLNEKRAYPQEKILWIGSFLISSIATCLKTRYDQIGQIASDQFKTLPTVGSGRKFYLSWSHYLVLMRISNEDARHFYEIEAVKNDWSLSQLKRQYGSSRNTPRVSRKHHRPSPAVPAGTRHRLCVHGPPSPLHV